MAIVSDEVIDSFLAGDHAAFKEVYAAYRRPITSISRNFMVNPSDFDDLYHNIMIKMWTKRHLFRQGSDFYTWVHTIAKNTIITHLTSKYNRAHDIRTFEDSPPSQHPTLQNELLAEQYELLMNVSLSQIAPNYRDVLESWLFRSDDSSYEHVAADSDIPLGTVKSRISRGREQLYERLLGLVQEIYPEIPTPFKEAKMYVNARIKRS